MRKLTIWVLLILLLLLPILVASQPERVYHLKLLAVQEIGDQYQGSDADLYLELRPGTGRVFLDTYPLTKLDTQISTRFAKEIACSHFQLDCGKYDFIYTIRAKSTIIGGPSAGAAIAALTTIGMLDLSHDETIAVTGTINSGGIVGPVGGVKEKIDAASQVHLTKVLIPQGTPLTSLNESNNTKTELNPSNATSSTPPTPLNIITYANTTLNLEVIEIGTVDQVVYYLTGENLNNQTASIEANDEYNVIMQDLKEILCTRITEIEQQITREHLNYNDSIQQKVISKQQNAQNATAKGDYYSAASYCFSIDITLKEYYFSQRALTKEQVERLMQIESQQAQELETQVATQNIETISDLQTLMIVKERIGDVKNQLRTFNEQKETLPLAQMYTQLAYTQERLFTAKSWMKFFAMPGKKFDLSQDQLRSTCVQKISEAQERIEYTTLIIGAIHTVFIKEKINNANKALEANDYPLCLITATQAKSDADAILSTLGVEEQTITKLIENKRAAVIRTISQNSKEDIFPILGYSYYQYANSLEESDRFTALLYLEYALEISELNIYFPDEKTFRVTPKSKVNIQRYLFIAEGFIAGILLSAIIFFIIHKKTKQPPKLEWMPKKKKF